MGVFKQKICKQVFTNSDEKIITDIPVSMTEPFWFWLSLWKKKTKALQHVLQQTQHMASVQLTISFVGGSFFVLQKNSRNWALAQSPSNSISLASWDK